jgi:predicted transcriptional regulator of viral defense system
MERANLKHFEDTLKKGGLPLFTANDIVRIFGWSPTAVRFLLHRYGKKGVLARIKRGLYKLTSVAVPDFFIANRLYEPSYISMETALSFYGIIVETVYAITSVSPRVGKTFNALNKEFRYRKIKQSAYTGYVPIQRGDTTILMADPEKALADYYYFVARGACAPLDKDRLRTEKLNKNKIMKYAHLFNDKNMEDLLNELV